MALTPKDCRFVVVMLVVEVGLHNDVQEREHAARRPPNDIDLSVAVRVVDRREDAAAAAERRNAILGQGVWRG